MGRSAERIEEDGEEDGEDRLVIGWIRLGAGEDELLLAAVVL